MSCEQFHLLLAGYVDDEISTIERQAVEEHLAACRACKALLGEQRAAAAAFATYPVEAAGEADWDRVWSGIEGRLPTPAKRVALESLSGISVSDEGDEEDDDAEALQLTEADEVKQAEALPEADEGEQPPLLEAVAEQRQAVEPAADAEPEPQETPKDDAAAPPQGERAAPPKTAPIAVPAAAAEADVVEEPRSGEPIRIREAPPRQRPMVFKPVRLPRSRHTVWAHVAGLLAAAALITLVLTSVNPEIRVGDLATIQDVEIRVEFDPTVDEFQPRIEYLVSDDGTLIPMVWIADASAPGPVGEKGAIQ